jgi:DNA-binding transcriptional regulator YiaG
MSAKRFLNYSSQTLSHWQQHTFSPAQFNQWQLAGSFMSAERFLNYSSHTLSHWQQHTFSPAQFTQWQLAASLMSSKRLLAWFYFAKNYKPTLFFTKTLPHFSDSLSPQNCKP